MYWTRNIKDIKREMKARRWQRIAAKLSQLLGNFRMTNEGKVSIILATGIIPLSTTFV